MTNKTISHVPSSLHISSEDTIETTLYSEIAAKQFTINLDPNLDKNISFLQRISSELEKAGKRRCSLSFLCPKKFSSISSFLEIWDTLHNFAELKPILNNIEYLEQPFQSNITFSREVLALFAEWPRRPAILISENDIKLDSLPKALDHGYAGILFSPNSSFFKTAVNQCLLIARKDREPVGKFRIATNLTAAPLASIRQEIQLSAYLDAPTLSIDLNALSSIGTDFQQLAEQPYANDVNTSTEHI